MLLVLALAVIASGIGVVYAKYLSRKTFVQLQALAAECDRADTRWMRLQLEESTLASYSRVETAARNQLGLHLPVAGEAQVLR
jgi:cell division protein FtsL